MLMNDDWHEKQKDTKLGLNIGKSKISGSRQS